jgi:predicted TIM-barrel fold metal-dependent hydrolase
MKRYLAISSDCHAGALPEVMRSYLDPKYRAQYDESLGPVLRERQDKRSVKQVWGGSKIDVWGETARQIFDTSEPVQSGGGRGVWDPQVRARELDRDGVAAEIVFPNPGSNAPEAVGPPFGGRMGYSTASAREVPHELRLAGARAHNRWLADFLSYQPERHAGVILAPVDDVAAAVAEITRARESGLFGGLLLPALGLQNEDPESFWFHPRYEPVWSALEDLDIPVQTHASTSGLTYGEFPGSRWVASTEAYWTARRALWFLLLSGVLERHPRLRLVITEAGGGDIPYILNVFDYFYTAKNPEELRKILPRKPSEYWYRQCAVGASPHAGRMEVDRRQEIGVANLLWGSDYPHMEGAWPYTQERMKAMFAGVPENEVALMLGENAARIYNFDLAKLRPLADRIGPEAESLREAAPVAAGDWGRLWTEMGLPAS